MKKINTIAEQTKIDDAINEILETYENSTSVVGWYAHPREVRGPFNRWFTVSEVSSQHKKDVAYEGDDCKYASAALNYAPLLALEIKRLQKLLKDNGL